MKISLLQALLHGIPEGAGMAAVCLAMMRLELDWVKIILLGILQSLAVYLIRLLPISFGIHTIILVLILAAYLCVFTGKNYLQTLSAALLAICILVVTEYAFFNLLLWLTGETMKEATEKWWKYGYPQIAVLFLVALLKDRYNRKGSWISWN